MCQLAHSPALHTPPSPLLPSLPLCRLQPDNHPNGGGGMWGADTEVPSFLYAMPLHAGEAANTTRVFLEETCLVARPALPFSVLERRLSRRLKAMGITVTKVGSHGCSCEVLSRRLKAMRVAVTRWA